MAMMLSRNALDEIERRCAATTPGPWQSMVEARGRFSGSDFIQTGGNDIYLTGATMADQDFMASAKQDIPLLIAEVRSLQAKLGLS